jgi:hypothetical protein
MLQRRGLQRREPIERQLGVFDDILISRERSRICPNLTEACSVIARKAEPSVSYRVAIRLQPVGIIGDVSEHYLPFADCREIHPRFIAKTRPGPCAAAKRRPAINVK